MQFPRIHSRRHLADQARENVTPVSDATLGRRVPVEVLRNQMAMYGMHSAFHPNGSSLQAIREVRRKTGFIVTPCRREQMEVVDRKADYVKSEGLVDIEDMQRRLQCSRAPLYDWITRHGIKQVCRCGKRIYYRPQDFEGFRFRGPRKTRLVLSDGREFDSIRDLCRAIGKSDNFIHGRLSRLNLPRTVENIEKVMNLKKLRPSRYEEVREWCEQHGVSFKAARERAAYHHVALTLDRVVQWYGGKRRQYAKKVAA